MKRENKIQSEIIRTIKKKLPGSIVLKTDPTYIQGFPDLLILYKSKWAALEVKRSSKARHRPNQDYYVDLLNKKSFASFIYPSNKDVVIDKMTSHLKGYRAYRLEANQNEMERP